MCTDYVPFKLFTNPGCRKPILISLKIRKSVKGTFYLRPRIHVKLNFTNPMICNSKNCQVATLLNLLLLRVVYQSPTGLEPATPGFMPMLYQLSYSVLYIKTFHFSLFAGYDGYDPTTSGRQPDMIPFHQYPKKYRP